MAAASAASAPPPPPPAGVPLLMHPSAFVKMSGFRVRHGHEAAFERRWAENTPPLHRPYPAPTPPSPVMTHLALSPLRETHLSHICILICIYIPL